MSQYQSFEVLAEDIIRVKPNMTAKLQEVVAEAALLSMTTTREVRFEFSCAPYRVSVVHGSEAEQ